MKHSDRDVLLIIDVQSDFCPGGALAVPQGDEIVPVVNRLAAGFATRSGANRRLCAMPLQAKAVSHHK